VAPLTGNGGWTASDLLLVFFTMLPLVADSCEIIVPDLKIECSRDAWLLKNVNECDTHFLASSSVHICLNMDPEETRHVAHALSIAVYSVPIIKDVFVYFMSIKIVRDQLLMMPTEDASLFLVDVISTIWRFIGDYKLQCGSESHPSKTNIPRMAVIAVHIKFGSFVASGARRRRRDGSVFSIQDHY
jgi:hypothetical protein